MVTTNVHTQDIRAVWITIAALVAAIFGVPSMSSNLAVKARYTLGSRKC